MRGLPEGVPPEVGGLETGVRENVLEEVQRDEGGRVGAPRRVIFTGSREWGLTSGGDRDLEAVQQYLAQWAHQELRVSTNAVTKLIARHVIGFEGEIKKRDRSAIPPPGLVIVQGGAKGLDTTIADVSRIYAAGLRRRSRVEAKTFFNEPQLADRFWLETYEADWAHRPRHLAGPERNQLMLDQGADHVIAFFAWGREYGADARGGTNDMVRRAVQAGVPVDIYEAAQGAWRKP